MISDITKKHSLKLHLSNISQNWGLQLQPRTGTNNIHNAIPADLRPDPDAEKWPLALTQALSAFSDLRKGNMPKAHSLLHMYFLQRTREKDENTWVKERHVLEIEDVMSACKTVERLVAGQAAEDSCLGIREKAKGSVGVSSTPRSTDSTPPPPRISSSPSHYKRKAGTDSLTLVRPEKIRRVSFHLGVEKSPKPKEGRMQMKETVGAAVTADIERHMHQKKLPHHGPPVEAEKHTDVCIDAPKPTKTKLRARTLPQPAANKGAVRFYSMPPGGSTQPPAFKYSGGQMHHTLPPIRHVFRETEQREAKLRSMNLLKLEVAEVYAEAELKVARLERQIAILEQDLDSTTR